MEIRRATSTDLHVLCALRLEFLAELRGVASSEFPSRLIEDTYRFFEQTLAQGRAISWFAVHEGLQVGVASIMLHDVPPLPEDSRHVEGYLINMYVRPEFRRNGIGRRLLEACLGLANQHGIRRFYLYATPAGRPMYAEAGFKGHEDWMVVQVPKA